MNVRGIISLLNEIEEKIDTDPSDAKIKIRKVIDMLGWDSEFLALEDRNVIESQGFQ